MANSMNEWLKELRCAAGCDIGLIRIGPPDKTLDGPAFTSNRKGETTSYTYTVTVTGSLSVDCHRPVAGGRPHKPGTGLADLEDIMKKHKVKADPKTAKKPSSVRTAGD
jgi:hypothetical protein